MAIEDELFEHGAIVLGPVPTVKDALRIIAEEAFDAAILNVHLRDGFSLPVADALMAQNKPFIFVTSYEHQLLPPSYASVPLIPKPLKPKALVEALLHRLTQAEEPGLASRADQPAA